VKHNAFNLCVELAIESAILRKEVLSTFIWSVITVTMDIRILTPKQIGDDSSLSIQFVRVCSLAEAPQDLDLRFKDDLAICSRT
jgi:hypothetical protein